MVPVANINGHDKEGNRSKGTSSFWVCDLQITAQGFHKCMGGETYFGSDPKVIQKSDLQSHPKPRSEEESKATPLRCEPGKLVEEQATLVSLQKDDKVKNMDSNMSDFCSSHVHPQLYDAWGKEKTSSELPNEVEDKPQPVGCELVKLKEKNLMQRDEHS